MTTLEKAREARKKCYLKHREKRLAWQKEYNEKNKAAIQEYQKDYNKKYWQLNGKRICKYNKMVRRKNNPNNARRKTTKIQA